jgi:hypothetical protein
MVVLLKTHCRHNIITIKRHKALIFRVVSKRFGHLLDLIEDAFNAFSTSVMTRFPRASDPRPHFCITVAGPCVISNYREAMGIASRPNVRVLSVPPVGLWVSARMGVVDSVATQHTTPHSFLQVSTAPKRKLDSKAFILRWSWRRGLNPRPSDYKELLQRCGKARICFCFR